MYICICKAVSESRIRKAVAAGATTLRDLRVETGLGTNCGKCVPQAYECLKNHLEAQHSPAAHHEVATRTGWVEPMRTADANRTQNL